MGVPGLSCTAFCDVFAYAVGSTIGKHALAASVSPGKTWEGSIGGLAASIIFAVIACVCFQLPLNYWQMIVAGIIIGIFAQLGDLVESLLKRNMKAKDAGNFYPAMVEFWTGSTAICWSLRWRII